MRRSRGLAYRRARLVLAVPTVVATFAVFALLAVPAALAMLPPVESLALSTRVAIGQEGICRPDLLHL